MKRKLFAIGMLCIVATLVLFARERQKLHAAPTVTRQNTQPQDMPLPPLSTPEQRLSSYQPQKWDIKYRIVRPPVIASSTLPGWGLYTSAEYGFHFTFPEDAQLSSTEDLGYQLPPNEAYEGSRDTFQIIIKNQRDAYFILFMNDPNFAVASTTVMAKTTQTINGLSMNKQILQSTEPQFRADEIIVYTFEHANKQFIWYGVSESKDVESINDFESIVQSMQFE